MEQVTADGIREWYRAHRRPVDAVLIAVLGVFAAFFGFSGIWGVFSVIPAGTSPWWTLATALPACVLVLTKQKAPWTSLVLATVLFAVDLFTTGGLGPFVVLLDVLWTVAFVARQRGRQRILIAMAVGVVVLFVIALLRTQTPAVAMLVAVQFGAFIGTDYWWAVAVSQAHELAELHRQRAEEAAAAADRDREEAVQREREAMARELHDVVAGHVLAMAIRAEAALSTPEDAVGDRAALQAVRDAGLDAHGALRSMIAVLRRGEGELSPTPRIADIDDLAEDARRAGLTVTLTSDDLGALPGAVEQAIVRVVREALANGIRHASGSDADVEIRRTVDGVRVRVETRGGSGPVPTAYSGGGWGLDMLAERIHALGGIFSAGPLAGGWLVEARLPGEAS
ncbi:MAG: sensor histidine kinase [Microbacterium sp.]|nr:sensor histidine kinase [Microbacterium sp.]